MKFNYIIFLLFTLLSLNNCGFITSPYIKDLSSVSQFDSELKKSNITTGMMLIYSTGCFHCHSFLKTYETLAQKFNNKLLFYAMSVYSDYHKRMPRTWGVPYILFFSDGYFYEFKKRRSIEELTNIIKNNYLPKCKLITYKNIENVYYNYFMTNKKYNNLIIGFFEENSNDEINNFRKENDFLGDEKIGLCYICKDFNENQEKNKNGSLFKYIENKFIVGYLRNNNSKIFKWDNKKDENDSYFDYEKFINEDLKSDYIDINDESKKYLINFLRNKINLIFSYETNEEKIEYKNYINQIVNNTEKKINYVLYNFSNFKENTFKFINQSGFYEIDEELNFKYKYNSDELKNKFFKELDKNSTNNTIINNELLIPEVKKENTTEYDEDSEDFFNYDYFFQILEKICVVLFTIVITIAVFFFHYNAFYKKVDQELIKLQK